MIPSWSVSHATHAQELDIYLEVYSRLPGSYVVGTDLLLQDKNKSKLTSSSEILIEFVYLVINISSNLV